MKNLLLLAVGLLVVIAGGCVSSKPARIGEVRQKLAEQESWRYQLPKSNLDPVAPVFPKLKQRVLKNGLTILVVEDHRLPIVDLRLVFKNGSALDPIGQSGLNHVTALMLKEGTRQLSSLELSESFANIGTELSVSVSKDIAHFEAAFLSNKTEALVKLIASMVQEPRFDAQDFARVKEQQQNALAQEQGVPSYVAQLSFLKAAYGDKHPYAYPSRGRPESVKSIELDQVKSTYWKNFGPNNAALVAVGDVSIEELEKLAQQAFGAWKKIKDPVAKISVPKPRQQMQTHLVSRPHTPQTFLLIGRALADAKDKDLAALEVFQEIIAGMPNSRLGANLREKKGWTYGVSSSINPLAGLGPMLVSTSIQVPNGADALKEILLEFDNLKNNLVSELELNNAKDGLLHSFASRYSTVGKISSTIARNFSYGLSANHDELFYQQIAKVSRADILAIAKRALAKDQLVAVAVGELEVMSQPLAKMDVGEVVIEK